MKKRMEHPRGGTYVRILRLMLMACLIVFLSEPQSYAAKQGFSDLTKRHWSYNVVQDAVKKGYVTGYPDGTFRPTKLVSRAEFLKMMVLALKLPTSQGGIPWYGGYISAAIEFGILEGASFKSYDGPISKLEAIKFVSRALVNNESYRLMLNDLESLTKNDLAFLDREQIQNRDVPDIALLIDAGILSGHSDGTIRVESELTRAESVQLIEKFTIVRFHTNK